MVIRRVLSNSTNPFSPFRRALAAVAIAAALLGVPSVTGLAGAHAQVPTTGPQTGAQVPTTGPQTGAQVPTTTGPGNGQQQVPTAGLPTTGSVPPSTAPPTTAPPVTSAPGSQSTGPGSTS